PTLSPKGVEGPVQHVPIESLQESVVVRAPVAGGVFAGADQQGLQLFDGAAAVQEIDPRGQAGRVRGPVQDQVIETLYLDDVVFGTVDDSLCHLQPSESPAHQAGPDGQAGVVHRPLQQVQVQLGLVTLVGIAEAIGRAIPGQGKGVVVIDQGCAG